jgi:uncharacterized protein YcfJ
MKHTRLSFWGTSALLLVCHNAFAEDLAHVISSTAIIQQVAVNKQVCNTTQVEARTQKSGAGALIGAIAGGAVGNNIGKGDGRTAATMLGIFGGAILGDKVEGAPPPEVHNVQSCSNQTVYEPRTAGYQVVYEYAGKQYSAQMPQDPGPNLRVNVTPVMPSNYSGYPTPPANSSVYGTPPGIYR